MSSLFTKTISELKEMMDSGETDPVEIAGEFLKRAEEKKDLNIFTNLDHDLVLEQAKESAKRLKKNPGALEGIPVVIKDNICQTDTPTTCSSKILENFTSPYDATVIEKFRSAGAVLFGRANLDEFAMGSSTENSAFGTTKNPWNPERVPGGSSGGSAAAVAALLSPASLGSDTGGSIRQPASFCGLIGLKPTYGRVSRYGLVAFASSLDQIGPMTRTVDDSAEILAVISSYDSRDSTSHKKADDKIKTSPKAVKSLKGKTIGLFLPDSNDDTYQKEVLEAVENAAKFLEKSGAKIVPVESKLWKYSIPIYYILATAEASSNLSRYDGVRYGHRAEAKDLLELYIRSRTEGFGPEVKRRILLGTFVLSSGYYDAYYNRAQQARRMVRDEYLSFFEEMDFILQPTSPTTAFKIGEKAANPLAMYQSDLMTISVNLGGVPSLSMPAGLDSDGLPIGLQITGKHFEENALLSIAKKIESEHFALDYSKLV